VAMGEEERAPSRELEQWSARLLGCSPWTAEGGAMGERQRHGSLELGCEIFQGAMAAGLAAAPWERS
jgi:hypothetical protein